MTSPPATVSPAGAGDPDLGGALDATGLAGLPAVWLRYNCPCPLCRDPVSGQRLLHITDIPADIAVSEVTAPTGPGSAGTVRVLFRPEDAKRLWSAVGLGGQPPRGSWPRYLADAATRTSTAWSRP